MSWLRSLFHRARLEADLNEELRDYLDREIEREIASGASPEEARRRALLSLDGIERVKEECRDARGVRWLEDTLSDLRFAVRTLRKAPVFTVTAVAALALCIGANAAIFSIVDTVLFRPLPFPDQNRLVSLTEGVPGLGYPVLPFTPPDYLFVAANNRSFSATGAYRNEQYEISGQGQPQRVYGARFSASLFPLLGIAPAFGRTFTQEEDDRSARVVVLNYGFAAALFGSPERVLGRTILLNREPYQVIGIMPRSFSFPFRGSRFNDIAAELFVPVSWTKQDRTQTVSNYDYRVIARLRPSVTVDQADAEVRSLIQRLVADYPPKIKQLVQHLPHFSLESQVVLFRDDFTGGVQRPLLLMMAAVGIVLLIGCSDVANLMFSRMVGRQTEFALRTALGASFSRLARQTLAEGLVLASAGGALGFCLIAWAIPLLVRLAPADLPRLNEVGLNWRITLFVLAITLATPLFFCLAPFFGTIRTALATQLRGEGRTSTRGGRERLIMSGAVAVQFSLAFLLMTAAGLLLRSFIHASESNPGFRPEHVASIRISLPSATYKTPAQIDALFDRLMIRLSALPGVRQVGAISDLPMKWTTNALLAIEGRANEDQRVETLFCLGDTFKALGIPLLEGRLLEPSDFAGKGRSVVISEGLAKRFWPHGGALGRRVKFGVDDPMNDDPWMTVVGVAGDVKTALTSQGPRLAVFTSPSDWVNTMNVVMRTSGDPLSLSSAVRREVSQLDPNLPAGRMETIDQVLYDSLSAERFRTRLLTSFAIAAMLLATLGIAGLLAYNAEQRMHEFGVRIALGADRGNLLGLVLRHCLLLSGAGIAIGLAASLAVTRTLSSLLYDTSPFDPTTFAAVGSILLLVALCAALIPAWRVIHADPIEALRMN